MAAEHQRHLPILAQFKFSFQQMQHQLVFVGGVDELVCHTRQLPSVFLQVLLSPTVTALLHQQMHV